MGGEGAIPSHSSGTLGLSFKGKNRTQKEFQKEGARCFRAPGRQSLLVFSGLEVKVTGKGTQAIRFSLWVVLAEVATQVAVTA